MKKTLCAVCCFFVVVVLMNGCKKNEKTNVIAMVNGTAISDTNNLPFIILNNLLDQFSQEKKIMAAPQEIEKMREFLVTINGSLISHLNEELRLLISSGDDSVTNSNKIETLRERIKIVTHLWDDPSDELLKEKVFLWNLHKALYGLYGGDVYFSLLGPIPVGAYTAFLQEKESEHAFTIFDETLRSYFWYYHTNYTAKTELLIDADDAKEAIETPPWEKRDMEE